MYLLPDAVFTKIKFFLGAFSQPFNVGTMGIWNKNSNGDGEDDQGHTFLIK